MYIQQNLQCAALQSPSSKWEIGQEEIESVGLKYSIQGCDNTLHAIITNIIISPEIFKEHKRICQKKCQKICAE
ncbi:hypothetical protein EYF80_062171 [Liparis tanakae]|uniref:Uncharacterized protein n=1 Tax=Liparis tanakae TaxID=230148 RepID=A0A4Z2EFY1_9TELE|nr:hypothetical protein EYF80_062171 [Liparis tanakae]